MESEWSREPAGDFDLAGKCDWKRDRKCSNWRMRRRFAAVLVGWGLIYFKLLWERDLYLYRDGRLIWERSLFNFVKMVVSFLHKELECKVEKLNTWSWSSHNRGSKTYLIDLTWDQALFSFCFENNVPVCKVKLK